MDRTDDEFKETLTCSSPISSWDSSMMGSSRVDDWEGVNGSDRITTDLTVMGTDFDSDIQPYNPITDGPPKVHGRKVNIHWEPSKEEYLLQRALVSILTVLVLATVFAGLALLMDYRPEGLVYILQQLQTLRE